MACPYLSFQWDTQDEIARLRIFSQLRQPWDKELAAKLADLESRIETHDENRASTGGYYPAKSLSTVFIGRYIRFCASGKDRNPYWE